MAAETIVEITLSKSKDYLVINVHTFDEEGFALESKRGISKIKPDLDPNDVLEAAQQRSWKLEGEPDSSGFYKAVPSKRAA
jgi:hypothetical protein